MKIDTEYLVYTDSKGRDPDIFSPTLKKYNQFLWSKPLPCGTNFELQIGKPKTYLYHKSNLGEFFLQKTTIIDELYECEPRCKILRKPRPVCILFCPDSVALSKVNDIS